MTNAHLHAEINFVIALFGTAICCSGILLFSASYMMEDLLKTIRAFGDDSQFGKNKYEYWAAIPIMLTGIIIVLSVCLKRYKLLKFVSAGCAFIVIVLALGVLAEESTDNFHHSSVDGSFCNDLPEPEDDHHREKCKILRKADKWFYVLLFSADIVVVFSLMALFALFADWMLFNVLNVSQTSEPRNREMQKTPMWEGVTGDNVLLHPAQKAQEILETSTLEYVFRI